MKDQTQIIRRNLAYFWSVVAAIFLFFAAVKWGTGHPEIQTLLIGFVLGGGIVGVIMGTYFTPSPQRPHPQVASSIEEAGNVTVNANSTPPGENPA